jgi:hypothetical protein
MGDRAVAEIKTEDGSLYVYSHWGGMSMPDKAIEAVLDAKPRWDDQSYATRIIVDQLTKDCRDQETGAGLMLKPSAEDEYNHDQPSVIIDFVKQELTIIGHNDEPGDADENNIPIIRDGKFPFKDLTKKMVMDRMTAGAK